MRFTATRVAGVFVVDLEKRVDDRGYFARTWCREEIEAQGLDATVVQINTGFSHLAGTVRGMHLQAPPDAEIKFVRCTRGRVFDVALDLRPDSRTYCQWVGVELGADDGRMLWIPEGCAHGYQTLEPGSELLYTTSVPYAPASARGVRWDDPAFGIQWPLPVTSISEADATWPDFSQGAEHE
ncbi:MAG TPA: dTDP-4-dehydrorhamnose 3,5-epimerase [Longimicrobiales bacterium]|nr:dTDP-4-dehydrorhamnose 3,5-epimerase [Longimicrobiales bacterium]